MPEYSASQSRRVCRGLLAGLLLGIVLATAARFGLLLWSYTRATGAPALTAAGTFPFPFFPNRGPALA